MDGKCVVDAVDGKEIKRREGQRWTEMEETEEVKDVRGYRYCRLRNEFPAKHIMEHSSLDFWR